MSPQTKVRLAGIFILAFGLLCWGYPSYIVYSDYMDLVNRASTVRLSVMTLWVPFGFLGAVLSMLILLPKSLASGEKFSALYSKKAVMLANKITIAFALLGIAFAAGWTYHSLNLMEQYGYAYSRDLTQITPTGIHLMYVKSSN